MNSEIFTSLFFWLDCDILGVVLTCSGTGVLFLPSSLSIKKTPSDQWWNSEQKKKQPESFGIENLCACEVQLCVKEIDTLSAVLTSRREHKAKVNCFKILPSLLLFFLAFTRYQNLPFETEKISSTFRWALNEKTTPVSYGLNVVFRQIYT